MMIHDTTGQKNKLEWTFQIWNLKHRKVRWTYRLQECRDPSAERPVYVCTYMFIVYRSILLYILLLSGIYMFVFHFPKSAKFSATNWNEFHFSKMKRFDVPSFFVIQSSVMFWNEHRTHDRMHFKSSCSLLCVYRVQWGHYLCLQMQWCLSFFFGRIPWWLPTWATVPFEDSTPPDDQTKLAESPHRPVSIASCPAWVANPDLVCPLFGWVFWRMDWSDNCDVSWTIFTFPILALPHRCLLFEVV